MAVQNDPAKIRSAPFLAVSSMDNQQYRPNLLDAPISVFTTQLDNQPEGSTTLRRIVSTNHYRPAIEEIRLETNELKQKKLKDKLRAISPVALLRHRKRDSSFVEKISEQWPLMTGDIDQKDNPDVDMAELKKHLARLPYVLLCAHSVRGGLWFVIRLPDQQNPETLAAHFGYVKKLFSHIFGITLDSTKGGNPTALRYVSYDAAPYTNDSATVMSGNYTPLNPKSRPVDHCCFNRQGEDELLARLIRFIQIAREGQRHSMLLKAAIVAGGYVAAGQMNEQNAFYALENVAGKWSMFAKSQKTIRDGIKYGMTKRIF